MDGDGADVAALAALDHGVERIHRAVVVRHRDGDAEDLALGDVRGNCGCARCRRWLRLGAGHGAVAKCKPQRARAAPIRCANRGAHAWPRRGTAARVRRARSNRSPRRPACWRCSSIVTLLARDLTVARAGRVRARGVARRLPARAPQQRGERGGPRDGGRRRGRGARERVRGRAGGLYALVGAATGLLIAGVGGPDRRHRPRRDARRATRAPAASGWAWSRPWASPRASSSTGSARSGCSRAAAGTEIAAVGDLPRPDGRADRRRREPVGDHRAERAAAAPERGDLRRGGAPARASPSGRPEAADRAAHRRDRARPPAGCS